ncbi:lia1, partial [Symbiodinium pilosum]
MVSILWVCAFISPTCLPTSAFRPATDTETAETDAKSGGSEIHGTSLRASEVVQFSAGGGASLIQSLAEVSAGDGSAEAGAPADECEKQLKNLEEHVLEFCRKVQPELKNGTFKWLTYITEVDAADMASKIMHALRWGKRDASHGLLFTKQAFHDKNSTLLLWSGVSPESREKWCKALNTYMLHAGSNSDLQTPFGCLIEQTKDQHNGKLLGGCEWPQQEPIWQTASDAVVWRNGDALVRFLVNKTLVKEKWTLRETIFFNAELPTLARYPPAQGFRVLNLHPHVRCIHLMPIIRDKIEQNGLLDDWRKAKTFSCVDTAGERMQEDPKAMDSKASEFLKPGEQMKPECAISPLTEEVYKQCLDEGHIDFEVFRTMARQFPMDYRPDIASLRLPDLVKDSPQLLRILPDVMEMFNTTISAELCLMQFENPSSVAGLDAGLLHQACREAHAALQKLVHRALEESDAEYYVREAAAQALGAMGKEAVETVLPELQNA